MNLIILIGLVFVLYKINKNEITKNNTILFGVLLAIITFKPNWLMFFPFILYLLYKRNKKKIIPLVVSFGITLLCLNLFFLIPNLLSLYIERVAFITEYSQLIHSFVFLTIRVEHFLYLIPIGFIVIKILRNEHERINELFLKIFRNEKIFYIVILCIANCLLIIHMYNIVIFLTT
jgi:hypothetical protein